VSQAADAGYRAGAGNGRTIGTCNASVIRSIDNLFRKKTRGADSIEKGGIAKIHRRLSDMGLRAASSLARRASQRSSRRIAIATIGSGFSQTAMESRILESI
jgi:hypothetical protein